MPSIPVTVFTDHDFRDMDVDTRPVPPGVQPRELKSHALPGSPYFQTLYLDSDTRVCEDLSPVFDVLKQFDAAFAVCHDKPPRSLKGVPDSFPELNGGVIVYRKSARTLDMFKRFAHNYRCMNAQYGGLDEPSLRRSVWESDVRVAVLPREYNFRVDDVEFASGTVKVLHGKNITETLVKEVNANPTYRMYAPGCGIRVLR